MNATTQAGAERALPTTAIPVRRIGPKAFATLLGIELLLLTSVLIWALFWLIPSTTPLATPHDLTPVQEAIQARLGGDIADPLIEIAPGLSARTSNLRGFRLHGTTYYYYIEGAANFDPFSRSAVTSDAIEILLRDDSGPATVVIYRVL